MRHGIVAGVLGLLATTSVSVDAQQGSVDKIAAEALFEQGRQLLRAGKYAEACPRLAESERLDPAVGTLLYLAECYELNGQTASAWSAFRSAESAAKNARQADREKIAHDRAAALERSLSRLTIMVPANVVVAGIEVKRDGVMIGHAAWGVAIPVDPGAHVIEAAATGRKGWTRTVHVAPNGASESVTLPALETLATVAPQVSTTTTLALADKTPPAASSAGPVVPSASPPVVILPASAPTGRGDAQRLVGVVVGAGGLAGVGLGTIYALQSRSKDKKASEHCPGNQCDPEGLQANSDALDASKYAKVAFVLGGVALAGGIVLYATAPRDRAPQVSLAPMGPTGLVVRGTW